MKGKKMEDKWFTDCLERLDRHVKHTVNVPGCNNSDSQSVQGGGFTGVDEAGLMLMNTQSMDVEIRRMEIHGEQRLKHLHESCQYLLKLRQKRIEEIKSRGRVFEAHASSVVAKQTLKKLNYERKLRQQFGTATRRLQELVFECVGETEKTFDRLALSQEFRQDESLDKTQHTVDGLRWKLFQQRLQEDALNVLSFKDISSTHDKDVFDKLTRCYGSEVGNPEDIQRISVVSYNSNNGTQSTPETIVKATRAAAAANQASNCKYRHDKTIAETPEELYHMLGTLYGDCGIRTMSEDNTDDRKHQVKFTRRLIKGTKRIPLYDINLKLSSKALAWLLWPQFGRNPVDAHVYYCIEERFAEDKDGGGESISGKLASIYFSNKKDFDLAAILDRCGEQCDSMETWPQGFLFDRYEGRHRHHYSLEELKSTQVKTFIQTCPDVVVGERAMVGTSASERNVKGSSALHFVPATIRQLLETKRFMELNSHTFSAQDRLALRQKYGPSNVTHNVISNLYVILPRDAAQVSALHGLQEGGKDGKGQHQQESVLREPLQIVPITKHALDELIMLYLVRSSVGDNTSKCLLEKTCKHAVLFPNNLDKHVPSSASQDGEENGHYYNIGGTNNGSSRRKSKQLQTSNSASNLPTTRRGSAANSSSTPTNQTTKERAYHALIVSYGEKENKETIMAVNAQEKADVITGSCLWRACNAAKTDESNGLCSYHQKFYDLIINTENGDQEIKRHLPRQTVDTLQKKIDHNTILKASSLISELLTNKLTTTVNGFCSRAANAAKPRKKSNTNPEERVGIVSAKHKSLEIDLDLAAKVRAAEREVVRELEMYKAMGVFPTDELVSIRQEYRVLDQERESLFASNLESKHYAGEDDDDDDDGDEKNNNNGDDGDHDKEKNNSNVDKGKKKKRKSKQQQQQQRLFRSRSVLLNREFARLVRDKSSNNNNGNNNSDESDDSEYRPSVSTNDEIDLSGEKVIRRERHHIEAELELEFCLRKISILRKKREQLEESFKKMIIDSQQQPSQEHPQQQQQQHNFEQPQQDTIQKQKPRLSDYSSRRGGPFGSSTTSIGNSSNNINTKKKRTKKKCV